MLLFAYPPYDLEFLVLIALVPLFHFIFSQNSLKKIFWGGVIAGFIYMAGLFTWLLKTFPFDWLGVEPGPESAPMIVLLIVLWLIQIVFLSLFFGLFTWIFKKIFTRQKNILSFLVIAPCLWILFEYLRAWGFGILWLGKETLFGPHWTFGNLAYSLHNLTPLIQVADIFGIYGISLLIVLINSILFLIFRYFIKTKKIFIGKQFIIPFAVLVSVLVFWIGYGILKLDQKETGKPRKVAILQTKFFSGSNFNPYQTKEVLTVILDLFQRTQSIQEKPDFVVVPEGFGIVAFTKNTEIAKYLLKDFWQPGQIFLENEKIIDENNKIKSRLFYYDLDEKEPIEYHDKRLLVPNGDFLSYVANFLIKIYSAKNSFENKWYTKGESEDIARTPKGNVGGTICSSIVSPETDRKMTKNGAQFLAVVSSDAPFHEAKSLLMQNLAMSKLRATENRRYFVQATNMGYSFAINHQGKILVKSSRIGNDILFSQIELLDKKTLYTKFGDWIILLSFLILIARLSFPQLRSSIDNENFV